MRRPFLMSALLVPLLLSPAIAEAGKTTKDFTYSYNVIWSSTVRLLRADLSYPIKEKDKETGTATVATAPRRSRIYAKVS